jgi:hypothetical protein
MLSRFHLNYAMYYDHQIMTGDFEVAAVSDLTMWPSRREFHQHDSTAGPDGADTSVR